MNIRAALHEDHETLLAIWLASVRATHCFLSESEIQDLLRTVSTYLASPANGLWVLCEEALPIGFMSLSGSSVDALFIAPDRAGRGGGRALLAHARSLAGQPLTVDVNEQNPAALAFYRASGFSVVGHSPNDDEGRPRSYGSVTEMEPFFAERFPKDPKAAP